MSTAHDSDTDRLAGRVPPDRFTEELLAWLTTRLLPPGVTVGADTPLFESGLINSLRILELIAWTERATGRRIPDEEVIMENFGSAARITRVFAGGEHEDR